MLPVIFINLVSKFRIENNVTEILSFTLSQYNNACLKKVFNVVEKLENFVIKLPDLSTENISELLKFKKVGD